MKRLFFVLFVLGCFSCQQSKSLHLFNGKDLDGWHADVPDLDDDSTKQSPFIVRDGLLVSLGTPAGHLISNEAYSNYRLDIDYRFAGKPGNCGVLVHVSTPRVLYSMFPKSIEAQMESGNAGDFWCIGEDISVPEMESRRGARKDWGSTDGKLRRIKKLVDKAERPVGEWNNMTIQCFERTIKISVNGVLVNDGSGCTVDKGQIAIQAEGSEVEFRKVELTPIIR